MDLAVYTKVANLYIHRRPMILAVKKVVEMSREETDAAHLSSSMNLGRRQSGYAKHLGRSPRLGCNTCRHNKPDDLLPVICKNCIMLAIEVDQWWWEYEAI